MRAIPFLLKFILPGALLLAANFPAAAQQYKVLHRFHEKPDGDEPNAGLVIDSAGDLYGTTYHGGTEGTVFRLTPEGEGKWTESVLYGFSNAATGGFPLGDVRLDASGNLYGTADPTAGNNGVVFELTPNSSGHWKGKAIHTFTGETDGIQPWAGVIFDKSGNLYGTTTSGGSYGGGCGVVFELTPSGGTWTETILHAFIGGQDGCFPANGDLVLDKAGKLYGTTMNGGAGCGKEGCGTVYELSQQGGVWSKETIYSFKGGADGTFPTCALVLDKAGNLYGTTPVGGIGPCDTETTPGCGTVFKLTPRPGGKWKKTIIYSPDGSSGGNPFAGVVFDGSGNLYGTMTFYGKTSDNCDAGCGSVYKLTPGNGGRWTPSTVYEFNGTTDGGEPFDRLLLDRAGKIFGTTYYGGSTAGKCKVFGCGVVFEIKQ
jgi:uncharacterized repeat protein (TIGR03803 family)